MSSFSLVVGLIFFLGYTFFVVLITLMVDKDDERTIVDKTYHSRYYTYVLSQFLMVWLAMPLAVISCVFRFSNDHPLLKWLHEKWPYGDYAGLVRKRRDRRFRRDRIRNPYGEHG